MGTRPDQRHVADQDIEQLRKLIDIGMAQEPPQTGHTWIVSGDWYEIVALLHHGHRSEFQHANGLVVVAVPRLEKKHRPTGIELDGERNDDEQGAGQSEASDCCGDVERSLDRSVEWSKGGLEE